MSLLTDGSNYDDSITLVINPKFKVINRKLAIKETNDKIKIKNLPLSGL
jgi:hypothetical protein